jgi:glyoxylase-like metal-dependent hydrolase (beta-lactamase superfamily II)
MKIHTLDLLYQNRPNTIAAYLVEGPNGPVLVECGPGSTLPNLIAALEDYGYQPQDIRHLLVTHIHLDHAGAAGWWAQQGTQVYVHRIGAPHLIDPGKLIASATRIYQDKMEQLWGNILPAPAENVTSVKDGDVIEVNGLRFTAVDTPGHASHHHVFLLKRDEDTIAFVGDLAGVHIPGVDFVDLPAPPPEFHLETWLASIDRVRAMPIKAIYPTHFDRVDDWQRHFTKLSALLNNAADFIRVRMEAGLDRDAILPEYLNWHLERARSAAMPEKIIERYEVANPHHMSVDGIMRYWRKKGIGSVIE